MTTKAGLPGLHAKLAQIRGELNGQIVKSGEHTQGGPRYKFVEALEVGRLFIEKASALGLTMLPESMEVTDIRESKTGKQWVYTVKVGWRLVDADTGETAAVTSFGQGADNSDKALPKAQTNAMKYAILMLLQAAGDDPERDEEEKPYKAAARKTATRRNARQADAEAAEGDEEERPARRRPQRKDPEPKPGPAMATSAFKAKIRARQHEVGLDDEQFRALGMHFTGKDSSREWTEQDAERVMAKLDEDAVVEMFLDVKGVYEPEVTE